MSREKPPEGAGGSRSRRAGSKLAGKFAETRLAWPRMSYYQRFEQIVAVILTLLLSLVVAVAVVHLTWRILLLVVFGVVDPANQSVFQVIFGMVMTLLIALEFNHSVLSIAERRNSIVQIKTVLLIALLALVRKFIILDATEIDPLTLLGLSAAVLVLGAIYWLVREQENKQKLEGTKRLTGGAWREQRERGADKPQGVTGV